MEDFVPNNLLQRGQAAGSSAFTTKGCAASGAKFSRGYSVITFSGQVAAQSPHCTQASSKKRNSG
jgi:hypothetical protein